MTSQASGTELLGESQVIRESSGSERDVADNEEVKDTGIINGLNPTAINKEVKQQKDNPTLHPFVYWSQSKTHISLRVNLTQVEDLNVSIADDGVNLTFSARGKGAHGLQDYHFALTLHSEVDREFDCLSIERHVLILIKKAHSQVNWPRLIKHATKLPWLRVDFDLYSGDDSDDSADNEDDELARGQQSLDHLRRQLQEAQEQEFSINKQTEKGTSNSSWAKSLDNIFKNNSNNNFDIFNPFNKKTSKSKANTANMKYDYRKEVAATDNSKNTARNALDFKRTYLFLYNLMMYIMFLKVYLVLAIKSLSGYIEDDTVQGAAFIVKLLTYTQLLETIHPMLGLVPGGPMMPFIQVIGRLLVNYFLTEPAIRLDSAPYAYYLFLVWSSIEIFRYSFYALRVFKVNFYPLTWCRYTLFIPLYPMGGICESMVLFSTIKHYEKTGQYSFGLPNAANISFSLPLALKIYIYILLFPTIYSLMKYMWSQRCKQLQPKEKVA